MAWTKFWDMSSGGTTKVQNYHHIYIELPRRKAIKFFQEEFHRDPRRVSCTCCGQDYTIDEYRTFEEASSYHRNDYDDAFGDFIPVEEYRDKEYVLVMDAGEVDG